MMKLAKELTTANSLANGSESEDEAVLFVIVTLVMLDQDLNKNKKPSALRFAFSACLFYNKQNFYCWTISLENESGVLLRAHRALRGKNSDQIN